MSRIIWPTKARGMFDEQIALARLIAGAVVCSFVGHRMHVRMATRLAYSCDRCGREETDEEASRRLR